MAKVVDGVLLLELNGTQQNPLFWWALLLLVAGIVVAVICFTMPTAYAIGSLFVFAMLVFVFNLKKQKAQSAHHFAQGQLAITPKRFVIDHKSITLSDTASIQSTQDGLLIVDRGITYRLTGFADAQELTLAKQVLEGKSIATQHAKIRLNPTA